MPEKSSTESARAPAADQFAAWPASWYLFGKSADIDRGPLSRRVLGRQLVGFRTSSGILAILGAECSHLGADLGNGRVVGESVQCPFHHWRYGADGACVYAGGARDIPPFARQRRYPAQERHGHVYFFNGPEPLFPLPFILGEDAAQFTAGEPFRYVADCSWYMNSAHAFDRQHFLAVHDRKLIGDPAIDCPAPFARRNRYHAEVIGTTIYDRLLRVFAGRTVTISLTIWGGTFAVITAEFGRVRSGFLMSMLPLDDGQTLCEGIVLARRGRGSVFDAVNLRVRRLFTHGYLADEARRLRGTRYNRRSFMPQDQDMIDFFHWVAALPQQRPSTNGDDAHERAQDALAPVVLRPVPPVAPQRADGRPGAQ